MTTDNSATVRLPTEGKATPTHSLPPLSTLSTSVRAERPSQSLPATSIPVPSSTTAKSIAGAWGPAGNSVARISPTTPPPIPTTSTRSSPRPVPSTSGPVERPSGSQVAATTPAPSSTTASSSAGARTQTGKSAMRAVPASITPPHRPSRGASTGPPTATRPRPATSLYSRIPATNSLADSPTSARSRMTASRIAGAQDLQAFK